MGTSAIMPSSLEDTAMTFVGRDDRARQRLRESIGKGLDSGRALTPEAVAERTQRAVGPAP